MKALLIIVGILAVILIISQVFAAKSQQDIETYSFKVVETYDKFEIRTYEATLFTSVKLPMNEYKAVSSKGFSILAGYIFGGNNTNEKIAMTSPVSMSLEDSMTVMFMVPRDLKKENLPRPDETQIEFREEPAKTVAAISFKGWADSEKIEAYRSELIAALDAEKIPYSDRFYYLGYNAPYELFNRKNEVIVELENAEL
jgi:hypothetical protein